MTFFSSLKKVIGKAPTTPARPGTAVAKIAQGVRSGVRSVAPTAPVRRGTAVASALRVAAARLPTTPIGQAKARGWRPPTAWKGAAAAYGGGGGGGGARRSQEEFFDEDDDLPAVPPPDDDDDDQAELAGVDVYMRHFGPMQLEGWTDDLAKIGVDLAKGAASGALTTVARGLSPTVAPKAPPPPPQGMSMTAKLAIGAAVAVPVLYLLTRKRSSPTPVAA